MLPNSLHPKSSLKNLLLMDIFPVGKASDKIASYYYSIVLTFLFGNLMETTTNKIFFLLINCKNPNEKQRYLNKIFTNVLIKLLLPALSFHGLATNFGSWITNYFSTQICHYSQNIYHCISSSLHKQSFLLDNHLHLVVY